MDGNAGSDPFHWTIPVEDPGGRSREWKVGARNGQVVTQVPPGEGFVITNPHYAAAAIIQASEQAELQRGGA